jgi:O-antigen/teichoic acid export membrane protein
MKRLFYLSTRYVAFTSFPVGIAGILLAYHLIHYLYGHEFIGAQRVLQIIFAASIFSNLSNPASAVLYGFEKQAFIYRYGMILAVTNIVIDLLLIKPYGAIGAAVCYGITTVLGSIGGLIYTCKLMGLHYPFFSVLKILLSSVIMGAAMEGVLYVNQEIPGFIIAIVTGTVVFLASTFILGSFEEEDVALIEHIRDLFPRQTKPLINLVIGISRIKKRTASHHVTLKRHVTPAHHS